MRANPGHTTGIAGMARSYGRCVGRKKPADVRDADSVRRVATRPTPPPSPRRPDAFFPLQASGFKPLSLPHAMPIRCVGREKPADVRDADSVRRVATRPTPSPSPRRPDAFFPLQASGFKLLSLPRAMPIRCVGRVKPADVRDADSVRRVATRPTPSPSPRRPDAFFPLQASGFKLLSLPRAMPISPSRQSTPLGKARNEGLR